MDDQGSGWPSDEDRLAQIEDELATLQDDITQLIRILPERLASGQRTPEGVFGRRTWPLESSGPWGRGRTEDIPLRFPSDAIGGVEKQLTTLRWNVDRLLNIVEVPPAATAGGPPRTRTRKSASSGPSRGDTVPRAPTGTRPTDDQADGGAGGDEITRSLDPTQGPGGSGPWHKKTPEKKVEPEKPEFGI